MGLSTITKGTVIFSLIVIVALGILVYSYNIVYQKNLSNQSSSLKDTINFRITWKTYSGRGETIQKIVDAYEAEAKHSFRINIIDGDEELNHLEQSIRGEEDIDIYMLPYRYVQYFGQLGLLEPLNEAFGANKEVFHEEIWKLSLVDDDLFGIPWLGHSMSLIYNKNLLDKAQVDPNSIKSLETLLAACQQIETTTNAHGIGLVGANHHDISWMVNQFIYGFGGRLVSDDGQDVLINSKETYDALVFYRDQLGQYAQPSWLEDTGIEIMGHFRNQEIAFEIQGIWGVTDIWKNGYPFETGVIAMKDLGLSSEVGPMMLSVPKGIETDKREVIENFIAYLISVEAQEMIMDGEYSPEQDAYYPFRLPVRQDMVRNHIFISNQIYTAFIKGFSQPSIDVPTPRWQLIKELYYQEGLSRVMANDIEIDEFLELIELKGDDVLKNN